MEYVEFANAEKLAEYLGYHYPDEIYALLGEPQQILLIGGLNNGTR